MRRFDWPVKMSTQGHTGAHPGRAVTAAGSVGCHSRYIDGEAGYQFWLTREA